MLRADCLLAALHFDYARSDSIGETARALVGAVLVSEAIHSLDVLKQAHTKTD